MATESPQTDRQILIGASWYPEMWPEEEWPKDIARMGELGFNIVRLFEFAWHRCEPETGRFDFAWALRVMDLCHKAGIKVMVGTPTAAPPAWLSTAHPDILQTKAGGKRSTHGMRKHYSVHSATYRELCRRFVDAMAEALAGHPALHSWQIDNEMSGFDYGEETLRRFHEWLKEKFGSVAEMNRVWGLEFWSQAYDEFAQVPLVTAAVGSVEIPERHHPSLIMSIGDFQNEAWTVFIKDQCDAIRRFSRKPITSNMTPGLAMDWFRHNRLLDRVGFSMYRDVVHYPWNIMNFDRMRAEKHAPYWLLETAPSWSAGGRMWNIHHDGRGVKAMSWMSNLLGGTMILYWQWREHWAGQEMQHGTLVTATGKWRPNREAMIELTRECASVQEWLLENPPARAEIALVLSNRAAWAFSIDPVDDDMRYEERWRDDYHLPLARQHIWRDVIADDADFSAYKVLIMPLMPIIPDATRVRLKEWVAGGGCLLLGPLSGYRTQEFTAFTDREFGGLEELMGAESSLRFTVHWMEDKVSVDFGEGKACRTRAWCEGFEPTTGESAAFYRGGYGDGHAAVIRNHYGQGTVITLGCMVSEDVYLEQVRLLLDLKGIGPVATGSGSILVAPRAGHDGEVSGYGVVNLAESEQEITLPAGGEDLLAGRKVKRGAPLKLDPLEVMLIKI